MGLLLVCAGSFFHAVVSPVHSSAITHAWAFRLYNVRNEICFAAHICTLQWFRCVCQRTASCGALCLCYTGKVEYAQQHSGTKTTINPVVDNRKKQCKPDETKRLLSSAQTHGSASVKICSLARIEIWRACAAALRQQDVPTPWNAWKCGTQLSLVKT